MLVKFSSRASVDIVMFGEIAEKLIKLMGHSGTIPSAIQAADLSQALEKLEQSLGKLPVEQVTDDLDNDAEFKPSLSQRALPLIELLKKSIVAGSDVMWDKN